MSHVKYYLVLAVCLAAAATAVLAKPSGFSLSVVKDKTICKTEVDYDINPKRIPRVIKVLKCASQPYAMCPARAPGGAETRCCGAEGTQLSCTEVLDAVLVAGEEGTYTINVPVGCACIKQDSNEARELK